jgi:hypothetical protein
MLVVGVSGAVNLREYPDIYDIFALGESIEFSQWRQIRTVIITIKVTISLTLNHGAGGESTVSHRGGLGSIPKPVYVGFVLGQTGTGTGFCQKTWSSSVTITPAILYANSFICHRL